MLLHQVLPLVALFLPLIIIYIGRRFYKHILAKAVKHQDMESEDYEFYKNLSYLIDTKVEDMGYDMYFSTEIQVRSRLCWQRDYI